MGTVFTTTATSVVCAGLRVRVRSMLPASSLTEAVLAENPTVGCASAPSGSPASSARASSAEARTARRPRAARGPGRAEEAARRREAKPRPAEASGGEDGRRARRRHAPDGLIAGGSAARRLGGSAARRLGGSAARRLGGSAARRLGGSAARRLGGYYSPGPFRLCQPLARMFFAQRASRARTRRGLRRARPCRGDGFAHGPASLAKGDRLGRRKHAGQYRMPAFPPYTASPGETQAAPAGRSPSPVPLRACVPRAA